MDDVDVGLFDRDWNNTLYFFLLNADEQIYMRYGGRDSASPDAYLDLSSLELALQQGVELHRQYLSGAAKPVTRPKAIFPREIPLLVQRTFQQRQCVECHLIGNFQNLQREQAGTLEKLTHLYRSDIKTLGITLTTPKGLVVKEAGGAVQAAGMSLATASRMNGPWSGLLAISNMSTTRWTARQHASRSQSTAMENPPFLR